VRILFLTTLLPGAKHTGSEVATQGFVDGLRALGHQVVVVAYRRAGASPPTHEDDRPVAERHIETSGAGPRAALWMARALLTRRPYSVAKYISGNYRRVVENQIGDAPPGLVVVDHASMGWLVPRDGWSAPYVYVAHNVEHHVYEQLAATGGRRGWANSREAPLIRRREEELCRGARSVWTLTAGEAATLATMGAGDRARSFDLPGTATAPEPTGKAGCDIATLGSWTWKSNAAGLEWFLSDVRPLLPAELRVEVGGAASQELSAGTPGVVAHGRVPDAMTFLQNARVVAVPSVTGAGVQVKTLDAIATGRAVVASETAMRGIADPPPTVRVAADAAAFAAAVKDALAAGPTPEEARAAQGWAHARRERFHDQLRAALTEIGEP
jgi:glycosyltransferase involved in cell wall biosynthesis